MKPQADTAPTATLPAGEVKSEQFERSAVFMDTVVTIRVVRPPSIELCTEQVQRAFGWFEEVERRCSRFDPDSELMRACADTRTPHVVSDLLFEAIRFALAIADASGGAFDPTVGAALEEAGFNRNFRTGETLRHELPDATQPSYRDVRLDPERRTVELLRPLVLDLGAVAKGLAIDMAAQELSQYPDLIVEAGGDMVVRGRNHVAEPWRVGIRHPDDHTTLIDALDLSDAAICTSGGYERTRANGVGHHIVEPRTGQSPGRAVSVTVIAPTAMAADAMATAAFVLGPDAGRAFLKRHGAEGLFILPAGEFVATAGWRRDRS